ncbi:MAG: hypothetical protein QOD66_21 [Solirubrobacteraceae bacterium]|nr:hypothetical protein [Solirubrobacteraceae bacterium]
MLLALLLGGCGNTQNTPRAAVAAYVAKVNAVEKQLAPPLVSVTRTIVQFARQSRGQGASHVKGRAGAGALGQFRVVPAGQADALLRADAQIKVLRGRLAALPAPGPAQRLRTLLLQLVDRQATLTHQMAKLVVFLPGFSEAMAPLGPALVRLERVLSVAQAQGSAAVAAVYTEKAVALRNFRAVALAILRALRKLDPPVVSLPAYQAQVRAIQGMATSAKGLAGALGSGSTTAARPLLVQFSRAATGPASLTAQKAQIAAIRAYNAQIASLNRVATAANRERLRISQTLK